MFCAGGASAISRMKNLILFVFLKNFQTEYKVSPVVLWLKEFHKRVDG